MAKVITKNSFTPGSAPSGLSAGELAVNVADKKLFVGNAVGGVVTLHDQNNIVTSVNGSTGAVTISGSGGFTYTSSAPVSASVGDRWIDSDTGKEYVYINDGTSSQWIEPVSSNGLVGVTYNSTNNTIYFGPTAGFSGPVISDTGYRIGSNAFNTQTTSYTLLSGDNGKVITMNSASGITLTVPTGLPVGFNTTVISLGTGLVGITGASGVTLNSFESKLRIAGQHAAASIISYSTNIFNVAGGLTA